MTQRVKPASPRAHRSASDRSSRRSLYLNIAFVTIIVLAAALLLGAAFASYAGAHWAEVASVNGISINQDQATAAANVNLFRITEQVSQLHDDLSAGRISQADFDTQNASLSQAEQDVSSGTVDAMVDDELQRQLAAQKGITITDAQIDAQVTADATSPESRHLQFIVVSPTGGSDATAAAKAQAQHTAESALAELKSGTDFADVAKQFSTDTSASTGGDAGWIRVNTASQDTNLVAAAFKLPLNGLTDVVTGTDGSYQIGKVTGIAPATTDPNYIQRMKDAGVSLDAYRASTKAILTDKALSARVTSDAVSTPSVQREVSQIKIDTSSYTGPGEQVMASHILYTPGGADPSTATPGPVRRSGLGTSPRPRRRQPITSSSRSSGRPSWRPSSRRSPRPTARTRVRPSMAASSPGTTRARASTAPSPRRSSPRRSRRATCCRPSRSQFGWHVIMIDAVRQAPADRAAAHPEAGSRGRRRLRGAGQGQLGRYRGGPGRRSRLDRPQSGRRRNRGRRSSPRRSVASARS